MGERPWSCLFELSVCAGVAAPRSSSQDVLVAAAGARISAARRHDFKAVALSPRCQWPSCCASVAGMGNGLNEKQVRIGEYFFFLIGIFVL